MLQKFIDAQVHSYETALREIKSGRKQSHWMWFIFPQMQGLGHSSMAQSYGINSLNEAREYLAHPLLGARLSEISKVLLQLPGSDAHKIFGTPDDMKLRSSMTLFHRASASADNVFKQVIDKYFNGKDDALTLQLLGDAN